MPRSANLSGIKSLHTYTIKEAAEVSGVSERTIRAWINNGLPAMTQARPILIRGDALIAFIKAQRKARKTDVRQHEFYCLKCRAARKPAGNLVECQTNGKRAKLIALCETCETIMHKPVPVLLLSTMASLFDLTIQDAAKPTETLPLNSRPESTLRWWTGDPLNFRFKEHAIGRFFGPRHKPEFTSPHGLPV